MARTPAGRRRPRDKDHAPSAPLREIRLGNFKSVRSAAVQLRPLTAIVGRNSSGKSTLLQGILALSQSVRHNVETQAFPLNGDLVRLGTYDEVRNFDADANAGIDIGFTAEIDIFPWGPWRGEEAGPRGGSVSSVRWDAHLSAPSEDAGGGQAQLSTIEFGVETKGDEQTSANLVLSISKIHGLSDEQEVRPERSMRTLRGRVELRTDGRLTDLVTGQSSQVDLMAVSGGLPTRTFKLGQRFDVRFRLWWDVAVELLDQEQQEAREALSHVPNDPDERASVRDTLRKDTTWAIGFAVKCLTSEETMDREFQRRLMQMRRFSLHGQDIARFEHMIGKLTRKRRQQLANAMNDLGDRGFGERVRGRLEKNGVDWIQKIVREEPTSDGQLSLEQSTIATFSLFQQVRYLGPLRAKPQVMYSPGTGQVDLGPEGEFAAAYLHANSRQRVAVPLPTGGVRAMPLGEGLNLWLEELGLAEEADAKDRGRLGIGLYVQPVGRKQSVDLTSVGVGVSQALPVVLLCLLSTPGSIVLIEQPELHLHPAMQLKLADFLLACTRSGRQIVIETHSEHIINRLRLRVVADDTSATADIVRLLFAEQDNGETHYRISDINEVGGLNSDWPKGFLDVAADESTRLLQESLAKKRARIDSGS